MCGDMKFIFECSTRELEHEKRNFISPSNHAFYLFYKHSNNEVFDDFQDCKGKSEDVSTQYRQSFSHSALKRTSSTLIC